MFAAVAAAAGTAVAAAAGTEVKTEVPVGKVECGPLDPGKLLLVGVPHSEVNPLCDKVGSFAFIFLRNKLNRTKLVLKENTAVC